MCVYARALFKQMCMKVTNMCNSLVYFRIENIRSSENYLHLNEKRKTKPFLILWSIAQYPKVSFWDLTFIRFKHFKIFNSNLLHCWQPMKKFHREREREKLMSMETIKTGEKRINRTKKLIIWGKLKKEKEKRKKKKRNQETTD